jgi:hypothetical protein
LSVEVFGIAARPLNHLLHFLHRLLLVSAPGALGTYGRMIGGQSLGLLSRRGRAFRIALTHYAVQHEADDKAKQNSDDREKKVFSGQMSRSKAN